MSLDKIPSIFEIFVVFFLEKLEIPFCLFFRKNYITRFLNMNDGYQKTGNVKTYQKPLRIEKFFREKDMRGFQIHFLLKKWQRIKSN